MITRADGLFQQLIQEAGLTRAEAQRVIDGWHVYVSQFGQEVEDYYLAGQRLCFQGVSQVGVAAQVATVGIMNPVLSIDRKGPLVIVEEAHISTTQLATGVNMQKGLGLSGSPAGQFRDGRWNNGDRTKVVPNTFVGSRSDAAAPGTNIGPVGVLQASSTLRIPMRVVLIPNNEDIGFSAGVVNNQLSAIFWWRELDLLLA